MGTKPLYRIKFVSGPESYLGKYYSGDYRWMGVHKELAEELTHKDAVRIMNHLNQPRIALGTQLEPV